MLKRAGGGASTLKRMKQEIACVTLSYKGRRGYTEESKVKIKNNSYNEEFDPGSG